MVVRRESQVHHAPQIGSRPKGAGDEDEGAEDHPGLCGGIAQVVPDLLAEPQVEDAGDRDQREGRERYPGAGDVKIEDTLNGTLHRLRRHVNKDHKESSHYQKQRQKAERIDCVPTHRINSVPSYNTLNSR